MKLLKQGLLVLCLLGMGLTAQALTVADVEVPESVDLKGFKYPLKLQGAGVRSKFFVDVYVGAFYSQKNIKTPEAALQDKGPKRMRFSFLRKVGETKFKRSWWDGFERNNSKDIVKNFTPEIETFINLFESAIQEGDEILLDFIPSRGVKVSLNGKSKGWVKNKEFYNLLLSTWMGERPPSRSFQLALLKLNAE